MFRSFALFPTVFLFTACTWVALEKPAEEVLVLPADRLTPACESKGTVKVSVLDKVGILERHDDEVVEDLDVLARNHAATLGGDTVVRRGPIIEGVRKYEIFRCTASGPDAGTNSEPARKTDEKPKVEVLPYDGGSDNR